MTFIPNITSQVDNANSNSGTFTTFNGNSVITNGYNKILITINSTVDSTAGGLTILFSDDNSTFTTFFTDTYFKGVAFSKDYPILKKYYKINYTGSSSASTTITTRLVNDSPEEKKDDSMMDAFNKLRVSNPLTLLDLKFPINGTTEVIQNQMMICHNLVGTGIYSYDASYNNANCIIYGTGNATFTQQSRKYCTYQPGKSLLFLASGIMDARNIYYGDGNNSTGMTSRIGYFDDNNGLFFSYNNGTPSVVLRNNSTDTTISQSNWNIDKLDGTGTSKLNLDFTKAQLFVIDFEWLGVGRIRFGFYAMGRINYCHQIININSLTSPYMLTPNLPIRYELSGSSSGDKGALMQICSTVLSEGGYNPIGKSFSASNNTTPITIGNGTETVMLTIRKKTAVNHQNIIPTDLSVTLTGANDIILYRIRLYLGPNSPGTISWTDVDPNSLVQYSTSITSFTTTNSIIINQGYVAGKGNLSLQSLENVFTNFLQLTSNISNISDIIVITATGCGVSASGYASLSWQEVY